MSRYVKCTQHSISDYIYDFVCILQYKKTICILALTRKLFFIYQKMLVIYFLSPSAAIS